MTAIAALVDKDNTIWIGGDSAGVAGLDLEVRKDPKVFIKGEFIFGFTTSFRMGQILHYNFEAPEQPGNMSVDIYMNTLFIDAIKKCLSKGDNDGGRFIIGYKKRLFIVDKDFQIGFPYKNYTAVGCGGALCKGSLHATDLFKDTVGSRERIKLALTAAESFSGGVRRPFVIKKLKI